MAPKFLKSTGLKEHYQKESPMEKSIIGILLSCVVLFGISSVVFTMTFYHHSISDTLSHLLQSETSEVDKKERVNRVGDPK